MKYNELKKIGLARVRTGEWVWVSPNEYYQVFAYPRKDGCEIVVECNDGIISNQDFKNLDRAIGYAQCAIEVLNK